jgi:nicotinate-nucleotide adenylyltransferase
VARRIGLFGGSFDPFHLGHRRVLEAALTLGGLDRIHVVPARISPHKADEPTATADERWLMAVLATLDEPRARVERWEIERAGPSYSIDTALRARREAGPEAEIVWIVGADQLPKLHAWHRIAELLAICRMGVVPRSDMAGERLAAAIAESLPAPLSERLFALPMEPIDLSATDLRLAAARGADLAERLPRLTALYVERYNLYSCPLRDPPRTPS